MLKPDPSKYIEESDLSADERAIREKEWEQYKKRFSDGDPFGALLEIIRSRQKRYPNDKQKVVDDFAELFAAGFANYIGQQADTVSALYDAAEGAGDDFWDIFRAVSEARKGRNIDTLVLVGLMTRGNSEGAKRVGAALSNFLSDRQSDLAKRAHQNDPRQQEKDMVRAMWDEWQLDPKRFRYTAEFAREALSKCQHLKSNKVVEGWCRKWADEEWKKKSGTQPAG